ncbi:MAG: hypoxanthine phosphoribosyltransferase [Clostridia bacterium]|nr:hypoxanthine phosphoribosyltransferase [Clostridia bacterium]
MNNDILKILVSEKEIEEVTTSLAEQIDRDYEKSDGRLVLLGILKGSVPFLAELMKKIKSNPEIEFMKVSSYGKGTKSSGSVKIVLDWQRENIEECDIIVVEDIIDSGNTLSYLCQYLKQKGAKSVRTCTLLDKPSRREVDFTPDYCGVEVPDEFVVGFGLDYDERYRALPYIGVLNPEVYTK